MQSYPAFTSVTINSQIDASNNFVNNMQYNPGGPGDIVVVRLFYQWPLFVTGLGYNIANLGRQQAVAGRDGGVPATSLSEGTTMKSISMSGSGFACGLRPRVWSTIRSGIAATEFAVIVPIMLVMFFGTVEISSGVAVDRKVTLVARTLSDLTSQSSESVSDTDMTNLFAKLTQHAIMTPYSGDADAGHDYRILCRSRPRSQGARCMGARDSQATRASVHSSATSLRYRTALAVKHTYLIFSEVQLSLHAHGRLRDGEGRCDIERCQPIRGRVRSTCVVYNAGTACTTLLRPVARALTQYEKRPRGERGLSCLIDGISPARAFAADRMKFA